jgi:F-type H+-transporting ATPase subunit delta
MNQPDKDLNATADVTAQRVARVYAEALLNAAEKAGQGDAVLDELDSLVRDIFQAEPKLEVLLSSAAVGRTHRESIIRKVFENAASPLFFNFLLVLNHHERLELIRPILVSLRELHDERAGRMRVWIHTAVPLPDDQKQRIEHDLRAGLRKEPVLQLKVDPDLLGGLRIRVGDLQFDGTVRTALDNIRNEILTGSSHAIQSQRDRFSAE